MKQLRLNATNANESGCVAGQCQWSAELMDQPSTIAAFSTVYSIIFLLGICGNAMVIGAVVRSRRMHTVTNILILNLAVSDINVTIVSVVFTPLATFMKTWLFGEPWCKLAGMLSCMSIYASSFTSTVIAIDRYLAVVHPLRPRMTLRVLVTVIVSIWCVSALIATPLGVYNRVSVHDAGILVCAEHWPSSEVKHLFSIGSFVLQFIVPLVIIAFCYSRTWICLENRLKHRGRWRTGDPEREEREIRRRRRMTRMLTAMVSLYAGCWMVFNLYTIMDDLVRLDEYFHNEVTFQVVHTVAVSSVVYNPFLYGWMNDNFQKQFSRMCACVLGTRRRAPLRQGGQTALGREASSRLCGSNGCSWPLLSGNHPSPPLRSSLVTVSFAAAHTQKRFSVTLPRNDSVVSERSDQL